MKYAWLLAVFLLVGSVFLLVGCEQIICNAPYILVGSGCCLDEDNNKICDIDEEVEEPSEIRIEQIHPPVVEKKVTEYVCPNGNVVSDPFLCPEEEIKEPEELEIPQLVTTNEKGTVIEEVKISPACLGGYNGGEIYFKIGTLPSEIAFEVKEQGGEFKEVYTRSGVYDKTVRFVVCDGCRGPNWDFRLEPEKLYIMRIKFDQTRLYNRFEYSNEYLIDTRYDSKIMLKLC